MSDGRAVVLGAGPVGQALIERLVANGTDTRAVTRSGRGSVPDGVELVAADISDEAQATKNPDSRVAAAALGPGQYALNASSSKDGSWWAARPSARPRAAKVASNDEPPVEKSGRVRPVIGKRPRFTLTLMKKWAAK